MKPHSQQSSLLTVLHDTKEWETRIDGDIKSVQINGQKLNDIHDLAQKIDRMTRIIKGLASTATFLAIVAVAGISGIGSWLIAHHGEINDRLRSETEVERLQKRGIFLEAKLKSLGWVWKDKGWRQIGDNSLNASK